MTWHRPITRWTRQGLAFARDVAEGMLAPDLEPSEVNEARARFLGELSRLATNSSPDPDDGWTESLGSLAEPLAPEEFWDVLESLGDALTPAAWRRVSEALEGIPAARAERERLAHPSAWRRALAVKRLGLLRHEPSHPAIRRALERGPAPVTFAAASALARLGDLDALRWLLEHPESTSSRRRFQLVALLRRFGEGGAPVVREALRGWEATAPIHLAAIEALGNWPGPASAALLHQQLQSGSGEARVAAARALGGLADPSSAPALVGALEDEEWAVRAQAARALGAIRFEDAVAPLAAKLGDPEWWVRRNSAVALGELGEAGRLALESAARGGGDSPAREAAFEVLDALAAERSAEGRRLHVA